MQPLAPHPLHKMKVYFAGRFSQHSRNDGIAKLEMAGGLYRERLSSAVNIVVLGENDTNSEGVTLQKARAMQSAGILTIISETEFFELVDRHVP